MHNYTSQRINTDGRKTTVKKWTALILSILTVFVLAAAAYAEQDPDPNQEAPFIELVPAFELNENPEIPDFLL